MRNLTPSLLDAKTIFQNIIDSKRPPRKQRLVNMVARVRSRFDLYQTSKTSLHRLPKISYNEEEQCDLEDCYLGATFALQELLADIKKSQEDAIQGQCQYCGILSPDTFDHYLPKSQYPEFSAFALNLLPCCQKCNGKKSTIFLVSGERQFLNLYFDILPQTKFLNVKLTKWKESSIANYWLDFSSCISTDTQKLVECHYKRLELLERYREKSPEALSEMRSWIQCHHRNSSVEKIQEYLKDEANRLANRFSPNYWKAVLHLELSINIEFIKECQLATPLNS